MTTFSSTLLYGALMGVGIWLLRWLLRQGGAGKVVEGAAVYRVRPGILVAGLIVTSLGLFIWGFSVRAILLRDWTQMLFEFCVGLPFLWLGLFTMDQRVVLDAEGVTHSRWLLHPLRIAWHDLDHFEIAGSALVSVLVLRPAAAKARAIALSSYAFHIDDLLRRLQQTKPLQQRPLHRQSWYRY